MTLNDRLDKQAEGLGWHEKLTVPIPSENHHHRVFYKIAVSAKQNAHQ